LESFDGLNQLVRMTAIDAKQFEARIAFQVTVEQTLNRHRILCLFIALWLTGPEIFWSGMLYFPLDF
jgi:hypothetical protein